jgi:hypothetical protein
VVGVDVEPDPFGRSPKGPIEAGFGPGIEGEIGHVTTVRADQVVVVLGEVLGQLVAGEVVAGDDAGHGADFFQYGQVAVDAGLRKSAIGVQNLGDGERTTTSLENSDQPAATAGVSLVGLAEQGGDLVVYFVVDLGCGHGPQSIW